MTDKEVIYNQIKDLHNLRNRMVDKLNELGLPSSYNETFNSLISKIETFDSEPLSIDITPQHYIGAVGDTFQIEYNVTPDFYSDEVELSKIVSSDSSILLITDNNQVNIVGTGIAVVEITFLFKGKTLTYYNSYGTEKIPQDFLDKCAAELNRKGYPVLQNTADEVYNALLTIAYAPIIRLAINDNFEIKSDILCSDSSNSHLPDDYIIKLSITDNYILSDSLSFSDMYVTHNFIEGE